LDFEVLAFVESDVELALLCAVSEAAAFFLVFFLVEVLVSVWSLAPDDPDCRAARAVTLPNISSIAATNANTVPLLAFISLVPAPKAKRTNHIDLGDSYAAFDMTRRAFLGGIRASSRSERRKSTLNGNGQGKGPSRGGESFAIRENKVTNRFQPRVRKITAVD
jgi:hypothetical protein